MDILEMNVQEMSYRQLSIAMAITHRSIVSNMDNQQYEEHVQGLKEDTEYMETLIAHLEHLEDKPLIHMGE